MSIHVSDRKESIPPIRGISTGVLAPRPANFARVSEASVFAGRAEAVSRLRAIHAEGDVG